VQLAKLLLLLLSLQLLPWLLLSPPLMLTEARAVREAVAAASVALTVSQVHCSQSTARRQ
jgi:hypothetical protein